MIRPFLSRWKKADLNVNPVREPGARTAGAHTPTIPSFSVPVDSLAVATSIYRGAHVVDHPELAAWDAHSLLPHKQ